jgi:hypothetical protein
LRANNYIILVWRLGDLALARIPQDKQSAAYKTSFYAIVWAFEIVTESSQIWTSALKARSSDYAIVSKEKVCKNWLFVYN